MKSGKSALKAISVVGRIPAGVNTIKLIMMAATAVLLSACGGGGSGGGAGVSSQSTSSSSNTPTVTFSASQTSISAGDSVSLSWQSTNATSCTASGGWSGSKSTSGSETVGPLQTDTSFSLSCSGTGGGTLREVVVTIGGGSASVNFSASETLIGVGDQVQLTWSSTDVTSCEASDGWSGSQALQGTFTTPPLTTSTSFKLTCFGVGSSAEASVGVTVADGRISWQAPTENVDGTPLTDLSSYNIYWGGDSRNYISSVSVAASSSEWQAQTGNGSFYFAITAVNSLGEESAYSNEIYKYIP